MQRYKQTLILTGVLLIAVCAGWYVLLYQPKAAKIESFRTETNKLLTKIQSLKVSDQKLAQLEKKVKDLQAENSRLLARIYPKSELSVITAQLKKHGAQYGLKYEVILPDYESLLSDPTFERKESDLITLPLHLTFKGQYLRVGHFIESLQDLPFLISVGEVSIIHNEEKSSELLITLEAVLYLRETSEPVRNTS